MALMIGLQIKQLLGECPNDKSHFALRSSQPHPGGGQLRPQDFETLHAFYKKALELHVGVPAYGSTMSGKNAGWRTEHWLPCSAYARSQSQVT
jgi:hypothetical protein